MRMWMLPPEFQCLKHLLGGHVETHMLLEHFKKGRKIDGYVDHNCLEPKALKECHDDLAKEIDRRGYHHKSPLEETPDLSYLGDLANAQVDRRASKRELLSRCPECRARFRLRVK